MSYAAAVVRWSALAALVAVSSGCARGAMIDGSPRGASRPQAVGPSEPPSSASAARSGAADAGRERERPGGALSSSGGTRSSGGESAEARSSAEARVSRMLERVARARSLVARGELKAQVLARPSLIAVVRSHVAREVPREVVRLQGEFFVGLGLIPATFDYEAGLYRLLEAQLTGFYEPADKTMYMASDLGGAAADATLAHELVHALQDQHYDLGPRLAYRPDDNDRTSALQGLAEGDATSAMMDVMLSRLGRRALDIPDSLFVEDVEASVASPELKGVPRVLRDSLVAPYIDGVVFVNALRRGGDWAAVDRVWRSPPETTEQLLHAEKYAAREPAEAVPLASPPRDGRTWSVAYEDVFGEEGLRIVLDEWMSKTVAAESASGWAGDRAVLYREGAEGGAGGERPAFAVAWRVRFDPVLGGQTDLLARRLFRALHAALHGGNEPKRPAFCSMRAGFAPLAVVRSGREVSLAVGPFTHRGPDVGSQGDCAQTLRWATDILASAAR